MFLGLIGLSVFFGVENLVGVHGATWNAILLEWELYRGSSETTVCDGIKAIGYVPMSNGWLRWLSVDTLSWVAHSFGCLLDLS